MAGSGAARSFFLPVFALVSLVLMKYVSSFMLAGGAVQTSPKGMRPRTVAKGLGEDLMMPKLSIVDATPENVEIAVGVVGGLTGGLVLPLFGGLVTGLGLASVAYILSKGQVTPLLKEKEDTASLVPYAEFAEEALQYVGKEAVDTYNWSVGKINAQRYR